MRFSYVCDGGHRFELSCSPGCAPATITCEDMDCRHRARRDFGRDFESLVISTGDPYRAYHLSPKKDIAAKEQQRPIDGPTDTFEKRRMERELGRIYVGDDTSGMTKAARRACEQADKKKR